MLLTYIGIGVFIILIFSLVWIYHRPKFGVIQFPENFNFSIESLSTVINRLQKIVTHRKRKIKIDFVFVRNISEAAFMVLLAQVEKASFMGKKVYITNIPNLANVKKTLFFKKSIIHTTINSSEIDVPNTFIQKAKNDPTLTFQIEKELKKISVKSYQELNTMITELVGNAVEHGIKEKKINWWMYPYRISRYDISFVFVDMGIGIIDSYKKAVLPDEYKRLKDEEILLYALSGRLGSSTKEENRGRGLPQMGRMVENDWLSNFVLITNSVSLRYIDGEYTTTKIPNFVGTYYSWTINKQNYSKWRSSI